MTSGGVVAFVTTIAPNEGLYKSLVPGWRRASGGIVRKRQSVDDRVKSTSRCSPYNILLAKNVGSEEVLYMTQQKTLDKEEIVALMEQLDVGVVSTEVRNVENSNVSMDAAFRQPIRDEVAKGTSQDRINGTSDVRPRRQPPQQRRTGRNAAIYKMAKSGQSGHAMESFAMLREAEASTDGAEPPPDGGTFAAVLEALSEVGGDHAPALVIKVLRRMQDKGFAPTRKCFTQALVACNSLKRYKEAISLFWEACSAGVELRALAFNIVLNAAAKIKDGYAAVSILEQMEARGVTPNSITLGTAANAFARAVEEGAPEFADFAVSILQKYSGTENGVHVNEQVYNSVMKALVCANRHEEALKLMVDMEASGHPPGRYTFSIGMQACGGLFDSDRAVSMLAQMKERGIKPDEVNYHVALQATAMDGNWIAAELLISDMKEQGIRPTAVAITKLITAYGRAGKWEKAVESFRADQRTATVFMWNAVITSCARASPPQYVLAMDLFQEMIKHNFVPDTYTYNGCLAACGDSYEKAAVILAKMRSAGVACNFVTYTTIMKVCANGGHTSQVLSILKEAQALGHKMNTRSYNTVLAAYARVGDAEAAIGMLAEMQEEQEKREEERKAASLLAQSQALGQKGADSRKGESLSYMSLPPSECCTPDIVSYNTCIDACAKAGDWALALWLLSEAIGAGLQTTSTTWASTIDACSKGAGATVAVSLLSRMKMKGIIPDSYCYASAIAACKKEGLSDEALRLIEEMRASGQEPTDHHYSGAIASLVQSGDWRRAMSLLDSMPQPNAFAFGGVIAACARARRPEKAMLLLQRMEERGIKPTKFAMNGVTSVFAWTGKINTVRELLLKMETLGIPPDATAYCGAITGLSASKEIEGALSLLREMQTKGHQPTEACYAPLIVACAKAGGRTQISTALDLLEEVKNMSLVPEIPSLVAIANALGTDCQWGELAKLVKFATEEMSGVEQGTAVANSALNTCAQAGNGAVAREILEIMENSTSDSSKPDALSYAHAITACGRGSDLAGALALLSRADTSLQSPSISCHNAAISACALNGAGDTALKLLQAMSAAGVTPDQATYRMTTVALEACGNYTQAMNTLNLAKEAGVTCDSWLYRRVKAAINSSKGIRKPQSS